jgi:uncharacterized protein with GYD domain
VPLYIALVTYTDHRIMAVRESPRRLDATKAEMGDRFQAVYMTMGAYDLVFVYEASDDAVAALFSLSLGMAVTGRHIDPISMRDQEALLPVQAPKRAFDKERQDSSSNDNRSRKYGGDERRR